MALKNLFEKKHFLVQKYFLVEKIPKSCKQNLKYKVTVTLLYQSSQRHRFDIHATFFC